jgi:la-related protein 1
MFLLQMDSRGWIEIGLLASFNRVKTLTADYQLVREVLMLSTMVQVREHHVRMGGWERFVLPDAPKSVVESEEDYSSYIPQNHHHHPTGISPANVHSSLPVAAMMGEGIEHHASGDAPQQWWNQNHLGGAEGEEEVEDDEEEDDVVFVMGPQDEGEGGMWSHERRT